MGTVHKLTHLQSWFLMKLSLDPEKKCVVPKGSGKRRRRNDMGWDELQMTDAELDDLVFSVMEAYVQSIF